MSFIAGTQGFAERGEAGLPTSLDAMLVAATGCTDAFWRPSTRYLNIQVELQQLPPKTGQVK